MDQRWWLAAGLFVACASEPSAVSKVGDGCILDSDCEGALLCVHRTCHDICAENRDCPDGQRCVRGGAAGHVCQPSDRSLCARNSDCPGSQTCAVDGQCRDECREDVDCVAGHICVSGTCATEDELVDGKLPNNGTLPEGAPCTLNSQCPADQKCVEGKCLYECINDYDCASQKCINNYCFPVQPDCVPGAQQACNCPTGGTGAQVCLPSGTWDGCKCPPDNTTGMGGMSTSSTSTSGMGGMSTTGMGGMSTSGMGGLGMAGMGGIVMPVTSSATGGGAGGMATTSTTTSSSSTGGAGGMATTSTTTSSSSTGGAGGMATTSTTTSSSSTGGAGGAPTTTSASGSGSGTGGVNVAGAAPN